MKEKSSYNFLKSLSPLDIGTLFYILFSAVFVCIAAPRIESVWTHFATRLLVLFLIFILPLLYKQSQNKVMLLLKNVYPLFFLNYFYEETFFIKNIIFDTDLDAFFMQMDQSLFGTQPSLEFSKMMPQSWFSECMFMCYFSYYALTVAACVSIYFEKPIESYKTIFIVIFSFYLYYILYIIIPVIGPQYYFNVSAYQPNPPYVFGKIMYLLHPLERATGAFPSSHVGMAIVISYIFFVHNRKIFFITIPFVIGICFATVYLKEHYLVDVIGGIVSAPFFIFFSSSIYNKLLSFFNNRGQKNHS